MQLLEDAGMQRCHCGSDCEMRWCASGTDAGAEVDVAIGADARVHERRYWSRCGHACGDVATAVDAGMYWRRCGNAGVADAGM